MRVSRGARKRGRPRGGCRAKPGRATRASPPGRPHQPEGRGRLGSSAPGGEPEGTGVPLGAPGAWPGGGKGGAAGRTGRGTDEGSARTLMWRQLQRSRPSRAGLRQPGLCAQAAPPGLGPGAVGVPPGPALRSPCAAPGGADFEASREAVLDSARERRRRGGGSRWPRRPSGPASSPGQGKRMERALLACGGQGSTALLNLLIRSLC